MSHAGVQRVLAFDFGLKHIGVAAGQSITGTASPVTTLRANDGVPDWPVVIELVKEWRPDLLLVGLPLNMDGTESEMSGRAREFGRLLGKRSGLGVEMVDERLTTKQAETSISKNNLSNSSHELSATLIVVTHFGSS